MHADGQAHRWRTTPWGRGKYAGELLPDRRLGRRCVAGLAQAAPESAHWCMGCCTRDAILATDLRMHAVARIGPGTKVTCSTGGDTIMLRLQSGRSCHGWSGVSGSERPSAARGEIPRPVANDE